MGSFLRLEVLRPGAGALLMAPAKLAGDNQPYAVPPPVWRGTSLASRACMSVDNMLLVSKPPQGVSTPNGRRMRYL